MVNGLLMMPELSSRPSITTREGVKSLLVRNPNRLAPGCQCEHIDALQRSAAGKLCTIDAARSVRRRRKAAAGARAPNPRSGRAAARFNFARRRHGGRGEARRATARRSVRRRSTAHDQGAPRSRELRRFVASVRAANRAASRGASGRPPRARLGALCVACTRRRAPSPQRPSAFDGVRSRRIALAATSCAGTSVRTASPRGLVRRCGKTAASPRFVRRRRKPAAGALGRLVRAVHV